MSTIEKVLIQIFESKNRIIDNVKQQILLFDHHLASKCLIHGIAPPPWLFSSSPSELNKEDLISGLLLPNSQPSIPYCSLYQRPVVTTDNVQLPHGLCSQVNASNEGVDQFLSGKVDEQDPSVTSPPQDCIDGMVSDICPDLCLSLARIQRSKSRQRALEHRSNAKVCKNAESRDKNGDACSSQNKVSEIASLRSGPVDRLELIRSGDNVVSYDVEKEERGTCRGNERSENFYSGRVTRSVSSVRPSKSAGGPSGAGNTSSVANQDDVVSTESICKSGQQHDVFKELLESKFEPVDNNVSRVMRNEERGQYQSKERGEDIYPGRITRSRNSVQPPKSVNGPPSVGKSFCVGKQDGAVLTESINKSRLQPDAADELLQLVKPVDNVVNCVAAEEERGKYQSKERGGSIYFGRVTRSKGSVQNPKFVNGLSYAGKTSDVAKCDGNMLTESISESKEQPNVVHELLALVKPAVISDETYGSRKAREHRSKEKESNVYQGRLTRSRSSSQHHNFVNKHLMLDSCPHRSTDDGICKSMQLPCHVSDLNELNKPFDITNESYGIKAKISGKQTMEDAVVDQYNDGSTRSRANHSAKLFKLVDSSNTLENEVTHSKPMPFNESLTAKSSDRSKGVELKEVSGAQVNSLLCANGSGVAELNQCDTLVADIDADSDQLVKAHSASSASNLDGGNNPLLVKSLNRYERVELEVVGKSPHSSSAMEVLPKQLDFEDFGECTLNEASSLILASEDVINSAEKSSPTPLPSADNLDEVTSVHYQEKYNSSHEKQLPEEREAFSKEEKLSETVFGNTSGSRTSNLNVFPSVKDKPGTCTDAVTKTLPESNEISEGKTFMEDLSTTFKVSSEPLCGNSLKDVAGSNLDTDPRIDYPFEKDSGKVEVVKSVMLVPEASNLNTVLCSGPAICSSALLSVADATSSDAIGHPCAALFEETKGHSLKQKKKSSLSQNQKEDLTGRRTAGGIDSVLDETLAKSSDKKVAIQSIRPDKHSSSNVEGSWPHKRRKIDGQQNISLSLSLSWKDEDATQLNADKFLFDEEQNVGKYNWKEKGRSEKTPSIFTRKQFDVASVSSLPQETVENFDHSADGTGAVDLSSVMFGSTRRCTADENQILLNFGDKSEFTNIEHLDCDERSKKESTSQLGEDGEFPTSLISSPCRPPSDLIGDDQGRPELEGFIIQTDSEQIYNGGEGAKFESFHLPKTTIERASLLEQLCKSACIHAPLPQFPTTNRLHRASGLCQSVPNGLLECMALRSTLQENDDRKSPLKVSNSCFGDETNREFLGGCFSDCLPLSSSQVTGNAKKPYLSPVGKFWDRITSNSDRSEKRGSLKLELPCINEENENTEEVIDAFQEITASKMVTFSAKREPLAEIRECPNVPASVSGTELFTVRDSLDSWNTAYSFTATENGIKQKDGKHNARKRRDTKRLKDNCSIAPKVNSTQRASQSLRNRFSKPKLSEKTSLRKGGTSLSQKVSKVNNIVSNVTSFIPIVQQRQATSIITGKRDVKVKALEAAEAAKKLAEKKENDRKMKKEALKLERARLEQEHLRQLELEKKKKEEERKKKEANMAAKKRQREDKERLEKERKRKRMEEARKQLRAPEENLCSKKDDKETKCQAPDERAQTMKVPNGEALKNDKMQKEVAGANEGKMSDMEFSTAVASTSDTVKASTSSEDFHAKVTSTIDGTKESDNQAADTNKEQSYDISPYKASDDEDDEEDDDDDEPNRKFVPSWASKNQVALAVASQQNIDPEAIFPPDSFCSIAQVLLPRKLQQNRAS